MELNKYQEIDLRHYWRIIAKRRWIILTLFSLIAVGGTVRTFTATPIYQATAQIVIEKENPNLVSIQEVMAVDSTGTDYYQTQYKIIESRSVAREVIRRLDLKNSPEFFSKPEKNILSEPLKWFREVFKTARESISALLNTGEKPELTARKKPDAMGEDVTQDDFSDSLLVNALISRIHVEPIRNSRLVNVNVEAKYQKLAAQMANAVVQVYIDQNMETKLRAAQDAVEWLTERIDAERKKVETSENELLRYKEANGIITNFSSDSENINAEKLAKLNSQVIDVESLRVEAETRYKQALGVQNSPEMLISVPAVLNNPLIQEINKMEVDIYNRMSELSRKYGSRHPRMQAIQSELADLGERKIKEAKRVVNSLGSQYKLALAREKSLKSAFRRQKSDSHDLNRKAIRYAELHRQVESSRNMYELLIKRFKETSLTEEMKTGNIRVIDRAEVPKVPVKPKKSRDVMLALLVGMSMGIGFAFLLEYLDNTIKFPEEIKEYLGIPYLGPVPVFDTEQEPEAAMGDLTVVHSPKSTSSESFRGIRTALLFSSTAPPRVILVSSAGAGEGKTLCAANLAAAMAQNGDRVALLDCDMRRPRVHRVFELSREKGMSDIMVGTNKAEEVILPSRVENLNVIPSGPISPAPSEILGSTHMVSLIEELREKYDRVIIDSPPITAVTDSLILAKYADGLMLVIRAGKTPRQVVRNALTQLREINANILGAIINGVKVERYGYYYYYQYYYYGEDGQRAKGRRKNKKGRKNKKDGIPEGFEDFSN